MLRYRQETRRQMDHGGRKERFHMEFSILRRKACVSCRGYQRYPAERVIVHKFKVAPRIKIIRP